MTDRLNFVDVEHLVAGLPDGMLEQLVDGPLPDGDDASSPWNCKVCATLRGPSRIPPVEQLLEWHEFEADTPGLDAMLTARPQEFAAAGEEWVKVAGMLSHARCCVIYALARVELAGRRL